MGCLGYGKSELGLAAGIFLLKNTITTAAKVYALLQIDHTRAT